MIRQVGQLSRVRLLQPLLSQCLIVKVRKRIYHSPIEKRSQCRAATSIDVCETDLTIGDRERASFVINENVVDCHLLKEQRMM